MAIVRRVVKFLDGDDDVLYEQIWSGLEDAAARLDFEKARRLRNDLRLLQQVVASQRQLRQATEKHTLLLVLPAPETEQIEIVIVVKGRPWARLRVARRDAVEDIAERLRSSWDRLNAAELLPIDHDSLDEAHILNRWLARNWRHPSVLPVEGDELPDWTEFAARAISLTIDELTRPTVDIEEETEDSDLESATESSFAIEGVVSPDESTALESVHVLSIVVPSDNQFSETLAP